MINDKKKTAVMGAGISGFTPLVVRKTGGTPVELVSGKTVVWGQNEGAKKNLDSYLIEVPCFKQAILWDELFD
ncbi:MAG: hypothetical protein CM15mP47_2490 [Methanobacteriota archaeon]|nr:MAG: hypothetical protein CM15mP47_2490 [Euryarchaeota archaeon]